MGRLGLIVGSAMRGADLGSWPGAEVLQRHGAGEYVPAHLVDHREHAARLAEAGCDRVLAVCSVGSLRVEFPVGTILWPHDFIALHLGGSSFRDERGHGTRGIDPEWRRRAIEAWDRATGIPARDGGVYWQAIGPRFETPAEIRLVAAHADVIGMTMAAECIAAGDAGLAYAAVCVVDNLANGLEPEPLTLAAYDAGRGANRELLVSALAKLVPALAEAP